MGDGRGLGAASGMRLWGLRRGEGPPRGQVDQRQDDGPAAGVGRDPHHTADVEGGAAAGAVPPQPHASLERGSVESTARPKTELGTLRPPRPTTRGTEHEESTVADIHSGTPNAVVGDEKKGGKLPWSMNTLDLFVRRIRGIQLYNLVGTSY